MNILKVLETAFFIDQLWWLFLNSVLVFRKEFKEKKVGGEIAFALISLFEVQIQKLQAGQLPWEHLSFLQNFLNFIITRNLKQGNHDECLHG